MKIKNKLVSLFCIFLAATILSLPMKTVADEITDYEEEAEERKNEPVESNEWEGWPNGPLIGAEAAILMDADTGEILYSKNIDEHLYPASTTKIMTCLVAVENASLDELVTINQSAIDANEWDGSNMGLTAGEQLTVDELLQGMLITSANEACNAIGEHIAGSMDAYVEMMNQKAADLGLENTHFVTTNGLQDDNHYTCARDLAIIAREFFSYDILCDYSSTAGCILNANEYHDEHEFYSKNKLYKNREYEYEYLVGSKTGYTGDARQTLVSCAEKDGTRLICVILKEESPYQFEDTIALFEYGFNNFTRVNVTANETKYNINHSDFFETGENNSGMFGESAPIIYIDTDATLLIPNNVDFTELTSSVSYENVESPYFGTINYYYNDALVGTAGIAYKDEISPYDSFSDSASTNAASSESSLDKKTVLVDIRKILIGFLIVIALFFLGIFGYSILKKYHFTDNFGIRKRLKRRKASSDSTIKKTPNTRRRSLANAKKNNRPRKPVNRDKFNFKDFDL